MPNLNDPGQNGQPLSSDPQKRPDLDPGQKDQLLTHRARAHARVVHHHHHGPLGRGDAAQAPHRSRVGTLD